jgi:putative transposase
VISDAHEGLKKGIATVLSGASWQRCRVHFMRNLLATVPHAAREPVAALVRTIFAQPDHATALAQLRKVGDGLRARFPRAAELLEDAAEDVLAYHTSPPHTPDSSIRPTRSSGLTRRSSAARRSSGSFRTALRCSAWSARS